MKTSQYLSALLLSILIFLMHSCQKQYKCDDPNDCNILVWKIEGEQAEADCEGDPLFGCDPVDCMYYHDVGYLDVYGTSDGIGGVIIHKHRNLKEGEANILEEKDYMKFGGTNVDDTCTAYVIDTTSNYRLFIVQIDTMKGIIEGEFSFTGIDNCQNRAKVEDGYFKLSY